MRQRVGPWPGASRGADHERSARRTYLALAVELVNTAEVHGSARHFAVSHVSIGAVAAAAGVSRGALYRLWPSQQDFWNDLIDFIVAGDAQAVPQRPAARATEYGELLDAAQDALLADPMPLLRAAIVSYPDPEAPQTTLAAVRVAQVDALRAHLAGLLHAERRRCVDGVEVTDLAVAATALGHGVAITGRMCDQQEIRFDSAGFEAEPNGSRSLLGVATQAVHRALTKVDPGARGTAPTVGIGGGSTIAAARPAPTGRRRYYLEIGARLALSTDRPNLALGHIGLDRVARAAGVTIRSLTKVWPDQVRFRLDLFSHLLAGERDAVVRTVDAVTAAARGAHLGARAAFRQLGHNIDAHIRSGQHAPSFLAFGPQLADHRFLQQAAMEQHRYLDECSVKLQALLASVSRRPRPGVTTRQLAILLAVVADGFQRLVRTSPGIVRRAIPVTTELHVPVAALVTEAVLDRLTDSFVTQPAAHRYAALVS